MTTERKERETWTMEENVALVKLANAASDVATLEEVADKLAAQGFPRRATASISGKIGQIKEGKVFFVEKNGKRVPRPIGMKTFPRGRGEGGLDLAEALAMFGDLDIDALSEVGAQQVAELNAKREERKARKAQEESAS